MNLTLTKLDFKTAMQSLESAETGDELLNQLDFVVAKLAEEETTVPVAELSAWLTGVAKTALYWFCSQTTLIMIALIQTEATTEMNLTAAEEVALIMADLFDGDTEAQENAIAALAEANGIAVAPETEDEINDLILANEDALYDQYLPVREMPVDAEWIPLYGSR